MPADGTGDKNKKADKQPAPKKKPGRPKGQTTSGNQPPRSRRRVAGEKGANATPAPVDPPAGGAAATAAATATTTTTITTAAVDIETTIVPGSGLGVEAAIVLQQDYSNWLVLIRKATLDAIQDDTPATFAFAVRAKLMRDPGNLVDCLVGVVVGTLAAPNMEVEVAGIVMPAPDVRRLTRRTMGVYIPPLIGDRLAAVIRSAISRRCFHCDAPSTPIEELLPANDGAVLADDACGIFLCDDCLSVQTIETSRIDAWQRMYIPSFTGISSTGNRASVCLRKHLEDFKAEMAKHGNSLLACTLANQTVGGDGEGTGNRDGTAAIAAMEHRKRAPESTVVTAAAAAAPPLPPATDGEMEDPQPVGTVRAELAPLFGYIGEWGISSLDSMCRTLGKDYRVEVTKLAQRCVKARRTEGSKGSKGKSVTKKPGTEAAPGAGAREKAIGKLTAQQCVVRLGHMAKRWRLVEREMTAKNPTVAGLLEARTWLFHSKLSAKTISTELKDWLLAAKLDGSGPGDAAIPESLADILSRVTHTADGVALLDSSKAIRHSVILASLFNPDQAQIMTNISEPADTTALIEVLDVPN
jgi:hypothetical protein